MGGGSGSGGSGGGGAGPPRDVNGAERYKMHLPFQVFCCESGTHVVDPAQTYYAGIQYRAGEHYTNLSVTGDAAAAVQNPSQRQRHGHDPDAPCLDSSQAHFCRDLWVKAAREGVREVEMRAKEEESGRRARVGGTGGRGLIPFNLGWGWGKSGGDDAGVGEAGANEADAAAPLVQKKKQKAKRQQHAKRALGDSSEKEEECVSAPALKNKQKAKKYAKRAEEGGHAQRQRVEVDADANAGSDFDAMPDDDDDDDGEEQRDSERNPSGEFELDDSNTLEEDDGDVDGDGDGDGGFVIPNSVFRPARILVNPRCVTTYAGVSHAQLALDLFGGGGGSGGDGGADGKEDGKEREKEREKEESGPTSVREKYVLDDWEGAPETFSCQEQK